MSILSDSAIRAAMARGEIVITPFDEKRLGGNSYDVTLGSTIMFYEQAFFVRGNWSKEQLTTIAQRAAPVLDCAQEPAVIEQQIPASGLLLQPNILYLAATVEYTETHKHVPYLDGKSSVGRLGIFIHATAGRGDVGFCDHWTMEIMVVHPIRVYAGMPIGQLTYHTVEGEVQQPYNTKQTSAYLNTKSGGKPVPSKMFRNFPLTTPKKENKK